MYRSPLPQFIALVAITIGLSGCSDYNAGGNTSCDKFRGLSGEEQNAIIQSYLEDSTGNTASDFDIMTTQRSVLAFCNSAGTDSTPIRDFDG